MTYRHQRHIKHKYMSGYLQFLESNIYVKPLVSSVVIVCIIRSNKKFYSLSTRGISAYRTFLVTVLFLSTAVFLNRRAAARYRALASIMPGRERPEETTICYKILLVQLITKLNLILYLSTCHTVYISVRILCMIVP